MLHINSYVKYVPITHYGYDYLKEPEINTTEHKKNLMRILNDNNIDWKIVDGDIYMKRKWVLNKKVINHFTNEANEIEFVKYIPVVLKEPNSKYEDVPGYITYINNYVKYVPVTHYGYDYLKEPEINTAVDHN